MSTANLLSTARYDKTHFIKLNFINKDIDAVDLPSILRSKSVFETMSTYFKETEKSHQCHTSTTQRLLLVKL